ncbi:hypothetical protein ACHAWF_005653 [Thalassiosira exigua]
MVMAASAATVVGAGSVAAPRGGRGDGDDGSPPVAEGAAEISVRNASDLTPLPLPLQSSPPPRTTTTTATTTGGARLLLLAAASSAAAAGVVAARWTLLEAGEVLLLFAPASDGASGGVGEVVSGECHPGATADGQIDRGFFSIDQCAESGEPDWQFSSAIQDTGEVLLALGTSPYLRAAPFVLLVVSSTALVVGVILTGRELRRLWERTEALRKCGEECSKRLVAVAGASDSEELASKLRERQAEWNESLRNRVASALETADDLVPDDVLKSVVRSGSDLATNLAAGLGGTVVLYALPDGVLGDSPAEARAARRRIVRAADPSLERAMFRRGGAWDVVSPRARVALRSFLGKESERVASVRNTKHLSKDDDAADTDEESSDTPLAAPVSPVDAADESTDRAPAPIGFARVVCAGEGDHDNYEEGPRETVAEALAGTLSDLIVSRLAKGHKPASHDGRTSGPVGREGALEGESRRRQRPRHRHEPPTPPPPLPLETFLRRTTIAASFLFLCHLRVSPSTRRAWETALKLAASLGLASAATASGVASAALGSNAQFEAMARHPVAVALTSMLAEGMGVPRIAELRTDVGERARRAWERLRRAMKEDGRLRAAVAFLVLYGAKGLCVRAGPRSRGLGRGRGASR